MGSISHVSTLKVNMSHYLVCAFYPIFTKTHSFLFFFYKAAIISLVILFCVFGLCVMMTNLFCFRSADAP